MNTIAISKKHQEVEARQSKTVEHKKIHGYDCEVEDGYIISWKRSDSK